MENSIHSIGGWIRERELGSGGFGIVTLWKHVQTHELVVIKQCRITLDSKNKARWKEEIHMMRAIQHRNIVSAREIPEEIIHGFRIVDPILGLEYCEGGDLRKVLSNSGHCCGLKESAVLTILRDVAMALQFLHANSIIHRDLKPENILISFEGDKIVHKVTDLGYAKQLDQTSLCTSFVGTLQYVAPELYNFNSGYTRTADYWSFGIMVFECIVGFRPFVISSNPFEWHERMSTKGRDDICGQVMSYDATMFSSNLPSPNQLSSPLQITFEEWLRIALRWDPQERGGIMMNGVRELYQIVEKILAMKVIHIFCMDTSDVFSYNLEENQLIGDIQTALQNDSGILVEYQELILPTGEKVNSDKPAIDCCNQVSDVEWMLYCFDTNPASAEKNHPRFMPLRTLQEIVSDPNKYCHFEDIKKAWAQALNFCRCHARDYHRLLQGQRALMICLVRSSAELMHLKDSLNVEEHQLQGMEDMFRHSNDFDSRQLARSLVSGIPGDEITITSWNSMVKDINQFDHDEVALLEECVSAVQVSLMSLQKSPLVSSHNFDLDDLTKKAEGLYETLIHLEQDKRDYPRDSTPMVDVVYQCITMREHLSKAFYEHLGRVKSCKYEIDRLIPKCTEMISRIHQGQETIRKYQISRQNTIWDIISHLSKNRTRTQRPLSDNLDDIPHEKSLEYASLIMDNWEARSLTSLSIVEESFDTHTKLAVEIEDLFEGKSDSNNYLEPKPLLRTSLSDQSPLHLSVEPALRRKTSADSLVWKST